MGLTALQVFTSSPRMWKATAPSDEKVADFRSAVRETGIDRLISHDTYLVNLCHADEEVAHKSRETLVDEIMRCHTYGIGLVVSHLGALLKRPKEEGFGMVCKHLCSILEEIPRDVCLLMETTAGQGSAINSQFEEIAEVLERCRQHRQLGVCVDTCHLFAAGYDLRTRQVYEETIEKFDSVIGLQNLRAIHLNDSKKHLGSRVDRHDNIGSGLIGKEAFGYFINDPRLADIPMVVETPTENGGHEKDIATLRSLATS